MSTTFANEGAVLADHMSVKSEFENAGDAEAQLLFLAKASPAFLEGKDAQATQTVLSMLNFLSCVNGVKKSAIPAIVEAIVGSSSNPEIRLKLLTTLFNTLPVPAAAKSKDDTTMHLDILTSVVKYVDATKQYSALFAALSGLEATPAVARATPENRAAFFLLVSDLCGKGDNKDAQFKFLVAALRVVDGTTANALTVAALALTNVKAVSVEEALDLSCVGALEKVEPLVFKLLKVFTSGDFGAFSTFVEGEGAAVFKKLIGVEKVALSHKMRMVALTRLASETSTLTFSAISKALSVDVEDAEEWILSAIAAGVINARIDQLEQTAVVLGVHAATFDDSKEAWQSLDSKLDAWRLNIDSLVKTLRQ